MRSSHVPAAWILERLGLDVALAGDLLEECARGRSTFWYWKQVLAAVWIGIWAAIFDHKVLALRAVATGCAVNSVSLFLWNRFLQIGLTPRSVGAAASLFISLSIILFTQAATGWVVARTHRAHAIPMVFVFALWLVLWYPGSIDFAYVRMLLVDSIDQPRFRPYLAGQLAYIFLPILTELAGLFAGGIVGAGPKKQPSAPALS
jgi:hypothetical protein